MQIGLGSTWFVSYREMCPHAAELDIGLIRNRPHNFEGMTPVGGISIAFGTKPNSVHAGVQIQMDIDRLGEPS